MTSRIASLRLQLIDSISGPAKTAAGSMKSLDAALARLGKAGVPGAKRLEQQLASLQRKAASILEFREARRGLKEASVEMKVARSNVQRLEAALKSASKPTKKMEADLRSAHSTLKQTTAAFIEQGRAVRSTEKALGSFGINSRHAIGRSQQAIRNEIAKTIREIRKLDRENRKPQPAPRRGGSSHDGSAGVLVGGGLVANTGRSAAQRGFGLALDFSQAADYQAALGGFTAEQRARLNKQAEKIGGDTRFTNADVVQAQTAILQGGIRDPQQIMNLTEQVTDYALAMGVTLEEGAETIRGAALSKRVDLGDAKAVKNFVDFMVWMAKNSGMNDDDVRQYMKYGGAATTGVNLPDSYSAAMGMILRRSGLRGDEAGVFARSASSKLVAPTQKGRKALTAMGINYDDFTTMPDSFNTKGLGIMMKTEFGKRIPAEMQKEIDELLRDGEFTDAETGETRSVASDRGEFTSRLSEILEPLFKDDKGKVSARDSQALAKSLGDYHKFSVDSVDVVGLFSAIMSRDPTLAQLNAFFTDRQGGRANMIAQQWKLFQEFQKMMEAPPSGIANKIGVEANSGLYGDWTRMVGTIETALTKAVQDWESTLRPIIKAVDNVFDGFINLDQGTRRLIEAFAAAAAVFAGYAAYKSGKDLLGNLLGGKGGGPATPPVPAGGSKSGWPAAILGWGARASAFLAPLLLSGDNPNNAYANASAEERQRMRDEANARTAAYNRGSSYEQYKAAAQSQGQGAVNAGLAQLDSVTASWPEKARAAMEEYGMALQTGGATAEAKAAAIATAIEQELAVTGHPDVDTSRLERALGLARQVAAAVRSMGGGGGGGGDYVTPPNSNKGFGGPRAKGGPVKKGVTYLVGEKGPEPFTPSQNGHITSNRDWQGGGSGIYVHAPVSISIGSGGGADIKASVQQAVDAAVAQIGATLQRQLSRQTQTAFSSLRYGDK